MRIISATVVAAFAFALELATAGCSRSGDATETPSQDAGQDASRRTPRVLLYGKETEWFHDSNAVAQQVMRDRGTARGWNITSTKDSAVFTSESLAGFDVVVFLLTSGMTMDQKQRDAFQSYITRGGGFVGVHSASHTDYDWPFMHEVVGANFCCHSLMMAANVDVVDANDPIIKHLPSPWVHVDEWYTFDTRPEANARLKILLAFDEKSAGSEYPGEQPQLPVGYHPITWKQEYGAARSRSFYTALGHPVETWSEEPFVAMVVNAVEWAAEPTSRTDD